MLKNVSPELIENIKDLKIALNELTVYDLNVYSMSELYYKVAHKLNEVIKELSRFEGVLSDEVIKQNEKLIYLLGEGLEEEVIKNIDRLIEENFFEKVINEKIFSDLNNKIDTFKTELESQNERMFSDLNNTINTFKTEIDSQLGDIEKIIKPTMNQQQIQEILNQGGSITFLPGLYLIDLIEGIGLRVKGGCNIKFRTGAILQLVTQNTSSYNILRVEGENITIINPQIIGDKNINTSTTGEHGHGISIHNSTNVCVKNGYIKNCFGDGIYVGGGNKRSSYIYIENVISDNNRRQGLSLVNCYNVYVQSCVFSNTQGVLPSAGIDIEPNPTDERPYNIFINNCDIFGNAGSGIDVLCSKLVYIVNSRIYDNKNGVYITGDETRKSEALIENCYIKDNKDSSIAYSNYTDVLVNKNVLSDANISCFRPYGEGFNKSIKILNNDINISKGNLFTWTVNESISKTIFNNNQVKFFDNSKSTNIYGLISQFNNNIFEINGVDSSLIDSTVFINFTNKVKGNNNIFSSNINRKMYIVNYEGSNTIYSDYFACKSVHSSEITDNSDTHSIGVYNSNNLPTEFSIGENITLVNGDTNLPCRTKQAVLKTIRTSNAAAYNKFIVQFCYPVNTGEDGIYMRVSSSDGLWGDWKII